MSLIKKICFFVLFFHLIFTQQTIIYANFTAPSVNQAMIVNSVPQSQFILISPTFDCSLSSIYTYQQSEASLESNTPTNIIITTTSNAMVGLKTKYDLISPTLSNNSCSFPGCNLTITNNCK